MIRPSSYFYDRYETVINLLQELNVPHHEAYIEDSKDETLFNLLKALIGLTMADAILDLDRDTNKYKLRIKHKTNEATLSLGLEVLFNQDLLLLKLNNALSKFTVDRRLYKYPIPTDQSLYLGVNDKELRLIENHGLHSFLHDFGSLDLIPMLDDEIIFAHFSSKLFNDHLVQNLLLTLNNIIVKSDRVKIAPERLVLCKSELYSDRINLIIDDNLVGEIYRYDDHFKFQAGGKMLLLVESLLNNEIDDGDFYFTGFKSQRKIYMPKSEVLGRIIKLKKNL